MKKILLIDDADFIRFKLKRVLEKQGFTVVDAENGEKGIEVFKKESPDLVILDSIMPGIQGIDVLRELKKLNEKVKVFVVSNIENKNFIMKLKEIGALAFFKKPFDEEKLLKDIDDVLS
jgi:DNA-binding response OmpR family regulator